MGLANSEQLAKQAKQQLDKIASEKDESERERAAGTKQAEKVYLPQGLGVKARPFIEARSRMHKKQNEVFEDPGKLLVKDPKPNMHYGWARLNAPITVMRAGQGAYRYMKPTEVKAGMATMFTTHKGASGELVCFGSLVLVEITDTAWNDYYIEPEIEAVARLASQQAQLSAEIEERSEGRARVVTERTEESETL